MDGITYTQNARNGMAQEGVSEADVKSVITHRSPTSATKSGNPIYTGQVDDGRGIAVIVKDQSRPPEVIAVVEADPSQS